MSAIEDTQDRPVQSEDSADPLLDEFQRLKKDIIAAERSRSDWRIEADMAYDYVAGHQWSDEDKQQLNDQHRPAITFNRTAPLVKAVCGLEVNNRQGVVYLPRQVGQSGINETITAAGKWVRDECHAEDEESEAFRDVVISGEGWTETRMDFEEDVSGKIVKERIDPREMGVDKGAQRANYTDARMIYRIREMDPEDVRALLGLPDDLSDAAMDASSWLDKGKRPADGGRAFKKDYPDKTPSRIGRDNSRRETVRVVQCQYWKREPVNLVATENDNEPKNMTDEEFATFKSRADSMAEAGQPLNYEHTRTMKKVYYQCFLGLRILDSQPMQMGMFQFKAMTGERDTKKKCFYGMVRDMIDPQMWSNKWLSQTLHIMNSNAKGGLLAETDAFINVKKAEREWSDPTKITWVKPGTLMKQKIKEKQITQLPAGLDQLMMFAISSIRDVTGINLELLGQADREQAASLEQQRRQSAMTILATMFDSLRKYRKHDGALMLRFIWLLPEGTLIRILEQGQYQYIPLIKQGLDIEKFDIIIDQAPTSPDQKQFVWAITAQILQMNILPPPAIIELLKYSPYPESVVQEIRKALGLDGEMPPDQLKQRLEQAEQALQMLEGQLHEAQANAKTAEDENHLEMLKLEIDEYKAKTDRLKAQWDARIKIAGEIATGQRQTIDDSNDAGEELPNIPMQAEGSPELSQKIDALANMVQQLMSALGGQQQQMGEPVPPPSADPNMEPQA